MTFVASFLSRHSIWIVADRRLTKGVKVVDDYANKLMVLETTDGAALVGYAGLGATANGKQPSEWMSRVVRGRSWPLEQSLGAIADAMKLRLPRHIKGVAGGHVVLAPAFEGRRRQLFSIDIAADRFGRQNGFRYARWNISDAVKQPHKMAFTGSGSNHLPPGNWQRELTRIINAHDRNHVSALTVADRLAKLCFEVHSRDRFTGPNSLVIWRYAKHGRHKGGGGHQFYESAHRSNENAVIPMVGNGMDVSALVQTILAHASGGIANLSKPDTIKALDQAVSLLPTEPDDALD